MRCLLVSLVGVLLLAGCAQPSSSPSVVSPPPSGVASPTPAPTPTPTPSADPTPTPTSFVSFPAGLPTEDPEEAAIIAGWREYWRVYELFAADPLGDRDPAETQYVTTGRQSTIVLNALASFREKRLRSEGGRVFRDVSVDTLVDSNGVIQAGIDYCVDSSQLKIFNIDTNERVARSGTYQERATMEKGSDGIWRVEMLENAQAQC